jgi:hypothetical protein
MYNCTASFVECLHLATGHQRIGYLMLPILFVIFLICLGCCIYYRCKGRRWGDPDIRQEAEETTSIPRSREDRPPPAYDQLELEPAISFQERLFGPRNTERPPAYGDVVIDVDVPTSSDAIAPETELPRVVESETDSLDVVDPESCDTESSRDTQGSDSIPATVPDTDAQRTVPEQDCGNRGLPAYSTIIMPAQCWDLPPKYHDLFPDGPPPFAAV